MIMVSMFNGSGGITTSIHGGGKEQESKGWVAGPCESESALSKNDGVEADGEAMGLLFCGGLWGGPILGVPSVCPSKIQFGQ